MEPAIDDFLKLTKIKIRFLDYLQVLFIITFSLYGPTNGPIFDNNYFKKLSNRNKFLYWISKVTTTTLIICPYITTHHSLQGAGTLIIPDTCVLYTPTTILIPTKITEKQISAFLHPIFPLINITDISKKINQIENSNDTYYKLIINCLNYMIYTSHQKICTL